MSKKRKKDEGVFDVSASKTIIKWAVSAIIILHVRKGLKAWRKS